MFSDPDFLQDEGILAIWPQVRAKLHFFIVHARNGQISTLDQKIWRHHRVRRPRFPIWCRNFGDTAMNMGQIAFFSLRMRKTALFVLPVKNLTSPSCSPTPIFYNSRNFGDTWIFKADIAFFIFALSFGTSGPKMAIFRGKIGEGVGRYWPLAFSTIGLAFLDRFS